MSPHLLLSSHVSPSILLCPCTLNNKTINLIFPFLPTFLFMISKLIYREWSLCVPWWWATSSEVCSFTEKTHFGWFFFLYVPPPRFVLSLCLPPSFPFFLLLPTGKSKFHLMRKYKIMCHSFHAFMLNILTQEINFEWISCLKQCINLEYIIHYFPLFLLLPCMRTSIWFTQYYPTLNDVNINLKFSSEVSVIY